MNGIRQTQQLNKRELENATPPSASWHADYRDTAWIYVGGLLPELSEGDVVVIFSQFGNPTHLNLIRDKETGKSKGFGFLKYEDQRSCDLAVDNLTGADVLGRTLKVDHTRYKKRDDEDDNTWRIERLEAEQAREGKSDTESEGRSKRRRLKDREEPIARLAIEDADEAREGKRAVRDDQRKHRHRHRTHDGENSSRKHREEDDGRRHRRKDSERRSIKHRDENENVRSRRRSRDDDSMDDSPEPARKRSHQRQRSDSRSNSDRDRRRRRREDD